VKWSDLDALASARSGRALSTSLFDAPQFRFLSELLGAERVLVSRRERVIEGFHVFWDRGPAGQVRFPCYSVLVEHAFAGIIGIGPRIRAGRVAAAVAATIAGSAANNRTGPRDGPNPKHPSRAQPAALHCDPNPKPPSLAQPPARHCAHPKDPNLDQFPAQDCEMHKDPRA
jgi:hypothetical protein